ncbi:MAG: YihY/virulence factor BrkB family protein [Anaerolineaceae bacterium]|nr:YihY/virulence factor BrkB family protein [Anaerolineaceae bacterium]
MNFKETLNKVKQSLNSTYQKVDEFTGGVPEILRMAVQRFGVERGPEASASLAYYTFFSIFPMILVIIVVGSYFVDQNVVQNQLLNLLQGVIPGAKDLVIGNIERVLQQRGAVTLFALFSLVWSAINMFNILAKNINRAFPKAIVPDFFKGRLMGFVMFAALGLLVLLAVGITTVVGLIPAIKIPINGKSLHETLLWQIGSFLLPIGFNTLMFWAMYYLVPQVKVSRKASLISALVAGATWDMLNNAFTWYLSSGLDQYRLVYGSVGTVVALLFWVYLTGTIMLLGAHLTASIQAAMARKVLEHSA